MPSDFQIDAEEDAEEGAHLAFIDELIRLTHKSVHDCYKYNLSFDFSDFSNPTDSGWRTHSIQDEITGEIDWHYAYDIQIKKTFEYAFMALKTFERIRLVSERV